MKMKRFVVTFLFLVSTLLANSDKVDKYYKELYYLSNEQRFNMLFSYAMGYKDGNDLGLTLAAIAWKESAFDKYPINLADGKYGSFSMYHVVLDYAAIRNNKTTMWSKSRLAETLIRDKKFAAEEAIGILKFFGNRKGCDWKCSVASYNVGSIGLKSKKGVAYANDVSYRVKALDRYFNNQNIYDKLHRVVFGEK